MGHGNGIKWYRHLELPGDGVAAATACLEVEPPRPPGTSCEFFAAASRLAQRAQMLRDVLARLSSIAANDGVWTGEAADNFRQILKDPRRVHYNQVPARYDGFARALRRYGSTLDGHQASIDSARAAVQSALDGYHRVAAPPPSGSHAQMPCADPGHSRAIQECRAAATRFQAAYDEWIDAVTACEHAIERVDDDKLHNAHGVDAAGEAIDHVLHTVVDATSKLAELAADLTGALALLTLPWPPAALYFLSLSSVFSFIELVADVDRKVQFHENVTPFDFALDALGTIPAYKPLQEGTKAFRAARAAGILGRLRSGRTATAAAFGTEAKELKGGLKALKEAGWWRTVRHPDPQGIGSTLAKNWDLQDAATLGLEAGRSTVDDRRHGYVPAARNAVVSVLFGPLSAAAAPVVNVFEHPHGRPDPAFTR